MKFHSLRNRLLAAVLLLGPAQLVTPLRADAVDLAIIMRLVYADGQIYEQTFHSNSPSDIRSCLSFVQAKIDQGDAYPGSTCYISPR